ncbi:MAG: hypothetical protein ACI4NB_07640 [Candidatus Ornithospirochaeta sp.]
MLEFCEYVEMVEKKYKEESNFYPDTWTVSQKIKKKIGKDGSFLPFYGFTTVFRLDDEDWKKCCNLADIVTGRVGDLLTILPKSTYHITLHTLWNDNNTDGGRKSVAEKMARDEDKLRNTFSEIMEKYGERAISMRALGISSDCSDVVSIKFVPDREEDYALIMTLFGYIEDICTLNKLYLPHISLGYFKAKEYTKGELERLFSAIRENAVGHSFTINMKVSNLVYETHEAMSGYTIIEL